MAVNHVVLSSQLLGRLENDNEDLDGRLKIAVLVFSSSGIPIVRKEEIIFEWLTKQVNEVGVKGSPEPYKTIASCVNGPRLPGLTMELHRTVVVSLIEALTTPLNSEDKDVEEKRKECILSVLLSTYFQNIFYRDVASLSKLVKEYCVSSEHSTINSDELYKISKMISNFSKLCLLHEELRFTFISEMMLPLCSILSKVTNRYEECENEIYDCMLQILFRESNLTEKLIELFHTKKDPDDKSFISTLIYILRRLPKTYNVDVVRIVFTLFLKAILHNNKENHSQVFKVFTLLCLALGIKVKGMVSIDQKPVKKWTREETFTVIASMVQLMDQMKLSIDCTIENDVTLQVWFTSMIIGLANINGGNLSPEFLKMITAILKFNPMVIESAHKPICTQIMLTSKTDDNVKKEYICLLKAILDGSLQVSRLQKFLSKFLSCVEEHLQFSDDISFDVEAIFPKEITDHFCVSVSMMPGSQVLTTTKSLQYHLHFLCTNKLAAATSSFGVDSLLSTEIVTHLLNLFLKGVKIADFNTPTVVKDKFCSIVLEIGESLEKFSDIIIESKNDDRLLSCFLRLCYSIGASILLMWEYDRDERRPLEVIDSIPTNLSYINSYIDADAWDRIAKQVQTSESDVVKNNFYLLIMQKMTAVSQIEEGPNGPGTQAARYLLANASPSWHWDNAAVLAPLLQDNELLGLLEGLIKSAGLDHSRWIPFVSSDYFSRNKRLVVATSTGLLTAVARHIHKNRKNGAVSHRVMSKVAVVPLLQYELSRLYEENEELECDLRCFFEEMIAELESYLLEDPAPASTNEDYSIGGFIEIITKIPYEDCSYALEVCMLIAVISLLCDIPVGTNNDALLLEKLNAFLREPKMSIPGFLLNLHSGALLRFLVKRTDYYPSQRLLIQRFCNFSATSSYTNHILIKYVKSPTASTLWQTSSVIKALAMHNKGTLEASKRKSLMKLLNATIPLLEKETPSIALLPDYFVTLKQLCKLNDYPLITKLFKNFKAYLNLAIANYEYGKPLVKLVLKRRSLLFSEFPPMFLSDMWEKVFSVYDLDDSSVFLNFCSWLSWEEIRIILINMHTLMHEGMLDSPTDKIKIRRCLSLWKTVIWADVGVSQRKEVTQALNTFMTPLLELVGAWHEEEDPVVIPVLDFLAEIGQCTSLHNFGSHILDMYFIILGEVPLEEKTLDHLNAGLDALIALFMFRRTLIVDRLPPFLQIFRKYVKALGRISSPDLEEPLLFNTTSCADRLYRGSEIMVKYKKDFGRVTPYIISDLLGIFEIYTLHPEIKIHFVNTLCSFFSILDEHGKAFLANSLNPACQELYKTYLDEYNRYYKYHGKI